MDLIVSSGENVCSKTVHLVIASRSWSYFQVEQALHSLSDACLPDPPAADGLLLDVLWFVNILPHWGRPELTDNILDSLTTIEGYYHPHSEYYTIGSLTKTQKVIFPKKMLLSQAHPIWYLCKTKDWDLHLSLFSAVSQSNTLSLDYVSQQHGQPYELYIPVFSYVFKSSYSCS